MVIAILTVNCGRRHRSLSRPWAVSQHRSTGRFKLQHYVGADAQTLDNPLPRLSNSKSMRRQRNYMYSLKRYRQLATTMVVDFDLKTDPTTD